MVMGNVFFQFFDGARLVAFFLGKDFDLIGIISRDS
jgi:hypothetical protein